MNTLLPQKLTLTLLFTYYESTDKKLLTSFFYQMSKGISLIGDDRQVYAMLNSQQKRVFCSHLFILRVCSLFERIVRIVG